MVSSPTPRQEPKTHRVLPDCCADIIFDFTGARGRSPAYVVGTMTRPICFSTSGTVDMLGIRFKAGAARSFLQVPISECTDLAADLECFWGRAGNDLLDRMAQVSDTQARIAILENHMLANFGWAMGLDPYVQYCVKAIESGHGLVSVSLLEKSTGLGTRQIERKFIRDIGIGPKAFSRIVRFLSVIRQAKTADRPDWSSVALLHGYSDQSHLVREFKEFSGVTPSAFIAEQ
jgi:AraC-like DNA-binding protein